MCGRGGAGVVQGEPQRQGTLGRNEESDVSVAFDGQGGRVAVVEQGQNSGALRLGQGGGDELLVRQVARQSPFQPVADGRQSGFVVGGLAKGAHHDGRGLHGVQALALHVPDEGSYSVRRGHHLVQIAADACFGDCRGVGDGQTQPARDLGHGPQQHALGRLGDRAHVGRLPLASLPYHRGDQARCRDAHDGQQGRPAAAVRKKLVVQTQPGAQQQRQRTDQGGAPPSAGQAGEGRPQRHQRQKSHVRSRRHVDCRDHGHHGVRQYRQNT